MPGWPAKILLPRNDIVSKMLLCNRNRPRPLKAILRDAFGFRDEEMEGMTVVDPNLYPEHEEDKHSIGDIRVSIPVHDINVEIQQRRSPAQASRWLHYLGNSVTHY